MRSTNLKQRIQSSRWVQAVIQTVSEWGQRMAVVILVTSCLGMLLSDWPDWWPQFPEPTRHWIDKASSSFKEGRNFLFGRYQRESPRQPASQPVTIVAIDEKSLAQMGQWPWPRYQLAALIDRINQHRPAAIGLDIYMPEVDQTSPGQLALALQDSHPDLAERLSKLPSNDHTLATSLRKAPSVLGAAGFDFKTYTTSEGLRTWPIVLTGAQTLPSSVRDYPAVLASLPLLQSAASGQALLSVDTRDGTVRQMPVVAQVNGQAVSSLAIEMFRVAMGESHAKVHLGAHGISSVAVGDLQVPTQPNGQVFIHYARAADTLKRYVSAADVLANKVDPAALSGKLVLIGLTGMGLNDMRRTALGEQVPGIEIQAQLMESFFDQRFVHRPSWLIFAEISLVLVVGGLMIWWIPRLRPSARLGLIYRVPQAGVIASFGINAAAISFGFYLFRTHGLMFDAASLFVVSSGLFGMLIAFVKASQAKAKEALRDKEWDALVKRAEDAEAALHQNLQPTGDKK